MDLLQQFEKMKIRRGASYVPRTKHLGPDGWAKYTNRLFLESSPYLLQHAHNPVNWYPWGDEAFEAARRMNRPVLLSVGYSTCHWCHVMEEESFEDEEIAQYLNAHYVAVKVDREERPDIDAIYMSAVQALTGRGGWPMTVWLTPERRPFYGGTYFPARDGERGAMAGFLTLLQKVNEAYHTRRPLIQESSQQLARAVQQLLTTEPGDALPTADVLHRCIDLYRQRFDPRFGGMQGAPKFPSSLPIRLLLRYHRRTADPESLQMARLTLTKMADSGMYDHVGGGFHRYATDEKWLVPHFEKMLYDNALLIMDYLEGYQVTGETRFKQVVQETLEYVQREMTSDEGAFYAATDADSQTPEGQREEGYYFTWTPDELEHVLGRERAQLVKAFYSVGPAPNFEGRHILHRGREARAVAQAFDLSEQELDRAMADARKSLYLARRRRPQPLRDEKILAAWNGLMISAHARAGLLLDASVYVDRAAAAARFVLEKMVVDDRLCRSFKDNRARHNAYLDDYAFMTAAFLDLYEATQDEAWFVNALQFEKVLAQEYEDKDRGGFFMTGNEHEKLIAREKPNADGAVPSGNSVALLNLLRLYAFTTQSAYRERAQKGLRALGHTLTTAPHALAELLLAVDFYLDSPKALVLVAPPHATDQRDGFLAQFRKHYLPNRVLVAVTEGEQLQRQAKLIPLLNGKVAREGKATAYVCEAGNCKRPTHDPVQFGQQIERVDNLI